MEDEEPSKPWARPKQLAHQKMLPYHLLLQWVWVAIKLLPLHNILHHPRYLPKIMQHPYHIS